MSEQTSGVDAGLLIAVLDAAESGFLVFDTGRQIRFCNAWLRRHFRAADVAADLNGSTLSEALPGLAAAPKLERAVKDAVEQRRSSTLSHLLHRTLLPLAAEDGEPLRQFISVRPIEVFGGRGCLLQVIDQTAAWHRERYLVEQERRQSQLIEAIPDLICLKDGEGRWLTANTAMLAAHGLSGVDYRHRKDEELALMAGDGGDEALLANCLSDAAAWETGSLIRSVDVIQNAGRAPEWYDTVRVPLFGPDGMRQILVSVGRDITAQRQVEQGERLAQTVFQHADEAIVVTDAQSRIIVVNPAYAEITGFSAAEVIGGRPSLWQASRNDPETHQQMWDAIFREGFWRGEIVDRRKDGEAYPAWVSITAVRDDNGTLQHFVALFTDITERKRREDQFRHLAEHDFLTGLPNRLLFMDRLHTAIEWAARNQGSLGVLYLDLDRFKAINDTYGHPVGDEVLKQVATILREELRGSDTVSRLGGDEFVALLADLSANHSPSTVARRLLQRLDQPLRIAGVGTGVELRVTPSVGSADYPQDGVDAETLLRHADAAMYAAKNSGRNGYLAYADLAQGDAETARQPPED